MNSTSQSLFSPIPKPGEPYRAGIAQRGQAQHLISEIHTLCASWLELPLCNSLLNAEHRLFERACKDPDYLEQHACTKARRCLQNHRGQLEQRFAAHLAQRFDQLDCRAEPEPPTVRSPPSATLSLLDSGEDDERALLDQMAARSEARHASLLFELGFRLSALAGQPPLTGERLPLSIQAMAAALLDTLHEWEMPARQRVMTLDAFDQAVGRKLASLYETINQHLLDAGILPHLRAYQVARPCDHQRQGAAGSKPVERRRAERKQIYHAVAVTDLIHGGSLGRLGNLSAGGLLLIGPAAPASGAVYQVRLELPGLHLTNAGTPVIEPGIQEQWQDAGVTAGQVWAGFRIVSISPADSALLDAWLALPGERD
jgi:hypothetical protein